MSLISLTDYRPMPRYDGKVWIGAQIQGAVDDEGPWSVIATVPFAEPDTNPAEPVERNFTVNVEDPTVAWLRVVFVDDDGQQDVANPVSTTPSTEELATIRDIALRLGRFLDDSEEVQVNSLIITATNSIYATIDKPSTWVPNADQRDFLGGLCVEMVTRAMVNPHALFSQTESLGAHSVTQQFSRDVIGGGMLLTQAEELAARRIVYGSNTGSARARSLANDVADAIYSDDIITSEPPSNGNGSSGGTVGPPGPAGPAGPAGPQGEPGETLLSGYWDYSAALTAPPANGQIRTTPDPLVVGQPMTIYLSARDAAGYYWDEPTLEPGDELRLRSTSGAVGHCRVTSFQLTVPGVNGYATINATLESASGTVGKNVQVEVTLVR